MLFHKHPWQLLRMPELERQWYEQAALREREREHERAQVFLESIASMLGAK